MARILKLEIKKTVRDEEENAMGQTSIDFCRQANVAQDSIPFEHDEWFAWLDYVKNFYHPPVVVKGGDWQDD